MKGLICAGGKGSRLYPLTKVINKHLVTVGNKPMIYYSLQKMQEAGIKEVLIVTGVQHCGTLIQQCGDGKEWGLNLTYKVQVQAGGIAQAISLAQNFAGQESLFVILGDNIFSMSTKDIRKYESEYAGARIFLKEVKDPERFGVATIYKKMSEYGDIIKISSIEEKPKQPKSNYAVTGIYLYDNTVFKRVSTLKKSNRGELEVTDLNNSYLEDGILDATLMNDDDWWTDAGTFESLKIANELVCKG